MADGIMSRSLKKVALGTVIVLVGWSVVAAQQTSPSQETKSSEAEETVFPLPTLDQLKTSRAEAEAATDLSESDKKNILSLLDQGIRLLGETERLNTETQKFNQTIDNQIMMILQIIEEDIQSRTNANQEWQYRFQELVSG